MDLENEFLKIGGVKLESAEATNKAKDIGICVKEKSENCSRCLILDERCKKAEERCIILESEMETKMSVIQVLQRQMKEFDERITRKTNGDKATAVEEGEKCVINLTDDVENDKVLELMVENKVFNCEKRKAESEVGFWKAKYRCLELRISSLESNLSSTFEERYVGLASPGSYKKPIIQREAAQEECYGVATPLIDTTLHGNARQLIIASSEIHQEKGEGCSSRTRKQLNFGEGTPDKMAPTTPAGGPIDICDSSDDDDEGSSLGRRALCQSMNKTHGFVDLGGGTASYKEELSSSNGMKNIGKSEIEDDITHCYLVTPSLPASKRKRASHIVHSDSGSDAEDNVLLRRLRKSCSKEACKRDGGAVNRDMDTAARKSKGQDIPKKYSHGNSKGSDSKNNRGIPTTGSITDNETEDDITHCYQVTPSSLASKRKRASCIVHSDSESDADDNVPLRRLRKSCSKEASKRAGGAVNRDMDTAARKSKGQVISRKYSRANPKGSESKNNRGILTTTECLTDDETEESESDSEGESLNGFIVSDSESNVSIVDESESEEKSEGNVDYGEIMSRIGRRKDHLIKWEFEADMLSAFGKNPELCMQAVCTLYRQQTSDEKMSKSTIHQNHRGFSQPDATSYRGSILGEFLTDEDPVGGLKKSVEELLEFQSKGLEVCRTLATRYSKQLFAMYQNKEDPLWPALCTNC